LYLDTNQLQPAAAWYFSSFVGRFSPRRAKNDRRAVKTCGTRNCFWFFALCEREKPDTKIRKVPL